MTSIDKYELARTLAQILVELPTEGTGVQSFSIHNDLATRLSRYYNKILINPEPVTTPEKAFDTGRVDCSQALTDLEDILTDLALNENFTVTRELLERYDRVHDFILNQDVAEKKTTDYKVEHALLTVIGNALISLGAEPAPIGGSSYYSSDAERKRYHDIRIALIQANNYIMSNMNRVLQ